MAAGSWLSSSRNKSTAWPSGMRSSCIERGWRCSVGDWSICARPGTGMAGRSALMVAPGLAGESLPRRRARFSAPQQFSFFSVAICEPGRRMRMALANLAANLGCFISTLPASRKRTDPVLPVSFLAQAQASLARVSAAPSRMSPAILSRLDQAANTSLAKSATSALSAWATQSMSWSGELSCNRRSSRWPSADQLSSRSR